MNFKLSAIAVAVAAATLSATAGAAAVDFHGYARSGVGASTKGGSLVCYWLGDLGHFRLGNECDTYLELAFDANLAEKGDTKFNLHTMIASGTQQLQDWEQSVPAWRQLWTEATNVGSGPLATANLWVGKRYYKRNDIHMTDFFYNQVTGPGAGIENADFGFAKGSYAYFRYQPDYGPQSDAAGFRPNFVNGGVKATGLHDLRLEGIQLGGFGSLDTFLQVATKSNREDAKGKGGEAFTLQHTIGAVGGFNRAVIQYAKDGANLDGTVKWWADDTLKYTGTRLLDHFVFDVDQWNGSVTVGYQQDKDFPWYKGATKTQYNIGGRVWYHFNDLYSIGGEVGHAQVKDVDYNGGNAPEQKLDKITLAGQISAGKSFWARPALRAYYTYAKWNDAAHPACTGRDCATGVDIGTNVTNGSTYGFQMEAWW